MAHDWQVLFDIDMKLNHPWKRRSNVNHQFDLSHNTTSQDEGTAVAHPLSSNPVGDGQTGEDGFSATETDGNKSYETSPLKHRRHIYSYYKKPGQSLYVFLIFIFTVCFVPYHTIVSFWTGKFLDGLLGLCVLVFIVGTVYIEIIDNRPSCE
jgi:hypothetical protein